MAETPCITRARGRRLGQWLLLASSLACAVARADVESVLERLRDGEVETALPELRSLARDGDARAQDALATVYLEGIGVPADPQRAMGWYCALAHHGEGGERVIRAVWHLAEYFRTGGGVPGAGYRRGRREREDPVRAYFWFAVMARQETYYDQVEGGSTTLGKMGVNAMSRLLFPEERAALEKALERWRADRFTAGGAQCLALPTGLTSE